MTIKRFRGDTSSDRMLITNDTTGDVVNLTGSTVVMTVNTLQNPPDDSTQVYQLTGVVTDPLSGVVEFSPNSSQANQVGLFYYDVQLTDQLGIIRTIDKGVYQYVQDITKV